MTDQRILHFVIVFASLAALIIGAAVLSWLAEVADADNDD